MILTPAQVQMATPCVVDTSVLCTVVVEETPVTGEYLQDHSVGSHRSFLRAEPRSVCIAVSSASQGMPDSVSHFNLLKGYKTAKKITVRLV